MMDTMAMITLYVGAKHLAAKPAVAAREPDTLRPQFSKRDVAAVRAAAIAPANTPREPRTLEELGVPRTLARELEGSLRRLGYTRGEQLTGVTFRVADGTSYSLKASGSALPGADAGDLAA